MYTYTIRTIKSEFEVDAENLKEAHEKAVKDLEFGDILVSIACADEAGMED